MAKKTRMSGVVDNSTMGIGLDIGAEMRLEQAALPLRRALEKAARDPAWPFAARFELVSGDPLRGNARWLLHCPRQEGEPKALQYEFKRMGSHTFLNVSGNPTTLISGANDVPVLVNGFAGVGLNAATTTFKYLNRAMYAILDTLLARYGFDWNNHPRDKARLVAGDIALQRYQIAWYSGELGEARDAVLDWFRTVYGGSDTTADGGSNNVGDALGYLVYKWPHNHNITLDVRTKSNRNFSVALYAKDEWGATPEHAERLRGLIRWDCTLNNSFLSNNRIKSVGELEARYVAECERDGYDVGFVRWIASRVYAALHLEYFFSLDRERYRAVVRHLEALPAKLSGAVFAHWNTGGDTFASDTRAAAYFGCSVRQYARIRQSFLAQGLNIIIPRRVHDAILDNRILGRRTAAERHEALMAGDGGSNHAPTYAELATRDARHTLNLSTLVGEGALFRVRKFKPVKVRPEEFWVYRTRKEAA